MTNYKQIGLTILGVAVVVAGLLFVYRAPAQPASVADTAKAVLGEINRLKAMATSSAMTVTTGSTLLLSTSTARTYAAFVNTDSTNYVCLQLKAGNVNQAAIDCQGIYLAPKGGSYEINLDNLYTGPVRAIANTASVVVTVVEAVAAN